MSTTRNNQPLHTTELCDPHAQDCIGKIFHEISDAETIVHMSGAHIHGPLKSAGPVVEIISEILHHPTGELAEKLVCGAGVGLAKHGINNLIAVPTAVAATAAASVAVTPVSGVIVGATIGAATYQASKAISEPVGHYLHNACHQAFDYVKDNENGLLNAATQAGKGMLLAAHHELHLKTETTSQRSNLPVASAPRSVYFMRNPLPMFAKPLKQHTSTTAPHLQANPGLNLKLAQIQQSQAQASTKVSQILGEIHHSYQAINQLKGLQDRRQQEEIARNNFQTVMQGFNLISQIGQQTGSRSLERVGTIGLSLAQGAFGIAQLTGTLGVAQVTGFAMAGPVFAIGSAALAIGSTLFSRNKGKKQSKAMIKMFQALSSQIIGVHQDMQKMNQNMVHGFTAMMGGMETLNQNLNQGFSSVHDAMSQYFSTTTKQLSLIATMSAQQYENLSLKLSKGVEAIIETQANLFEVMQQDFTALDFKLDDQYLLLNTIDVKLNVILSKLQELGFKNEIDHKKSVFLLMEQFEQTQDKKKLLKLLQAIRNQLQSATLTLKSLKAYDNTFSGWFHLHELIPVFNHPQFHPFNFDYNNLINLPWAHAAYECFNRLLPILDNPDVSDASINKIRSDILSILKQTSNPTAQFISSITSKDFLNQFFNFYSNKIDDLRARVEMILKPLRGLNQESMREYAKRVMASSPAKSQEIVQANTRQMTEQINQHVQEQLTALIREYNECIQTFKNNSNILFSVLEINFDILEKVNRKLAVLKDIPELHYRYKGIVEIRHDNQLPENTNYYYLDFDTINCLETFKFPENDITSILADATDHADMNTAYLQLINTIASVDEIAQLETFFIAEQLYLQQPHNLEEFMPELKSEELDSLIKLMEPVFDAAKEAKDKSIVYVMGLTGAGKSTLVNCLNGTRYEPGEDDCGYKPKYIETSKAEVCEVGMEDISKTIIPKIVGVPFNGNTISYCDLPGLNGSRDLATNTCEVYAPMILNDQVENVKGILWVVSSGQFEVSRGEKIKEMLSNLLRIYQADAKTLAKSITIVVTKDKENLSKKQILNKIKRIIDGMTNVEEKEKELLNEIWLELSKPLDSNNPNSFPVILSKIYDANSEYINEIHKVVSARTSIPKINLISPLIAKHKLISKPNLSKQLNIIKPLFQNMGNCKLKNLKQLQCSN